jgi:hypothetical protein
MYPKQLTYRVAQIVRFECANVVDNNHSCNEETMLLNNQKKTQHMKSHLLASTLNTKDRIVL